MSTTANVIDIFLQPGELYFGDRHTRIRTLLGSCVSVTLWHPRLHIGGMCHYMLPHRAHRAGRSLSGKYADEALQLLLQEVVRSRTRPEEYEVKLFGGGNMFASSRDQQAGCKNVSCRNVEAGRQLVAQHGFRIKAESLGGNGHRQIVFDVGSGDVWVKRHAKVMVPNCQSGDNNE